ncbi:capsular polysaccharide biosynthesis protein [Paracoccus alkenifer]|uniref:Capsular polysaccharide export protein n=1 Tax=Paracoccus alkenifer TaxID=65735 RepID=A0A1H6K3R6_9RHOB|nr:capsular polysaccharide biosynthesis protein [Paracoccus alkenifer]SEH66172.1 capsular polysaccharide export protein [Paracoccus alkenifer]
MPLPQKPPHEQRRLFIYNGGFFLQPRLRRILGLAGWRLCIGLPGPGDCVAVWGASPTAWRGRAIARQRGAAVVTVEDAFLRSVLPGRDRSRIGRRGPIGLLIDPRGVHFDPSSPSLIEELAASKQAAALAGRATAMLARLRAADLSKYNAHRPGLSAAAPGYVLVVDQTRGDASLMGAGRETFLRMLTAARDEHPGARIVLRSHPETAAGLRPGHLSAADLRPGEVLCDTPVSPWRLVGDAAAVYAVSSQLGYEAMLAGHRPRLFGQPFYAGWGLSDDEAPVARRLGRTTLPALFAASHLLAPVWYDPCHDRLTDLEGAIRQLESEARAHAQDCDGHLALGMRLWKRRPLARFFGEGRGVRFTDHPSAKVSLVWAGHADKAPQALRVEDGFLRSRGLGAALVPPLSLVADSRGIYYDPGRESDLEHLIAQPLPPQGHARAAALIARLRQAALTKYNLPGMMPAIPRDGHRVILVPGQVEDDASIRLGAGVERTNLALLFRTRAENPGALIVWKPHPDVEAGLRPGAVADAQLAGLADITARNAPAAALIDAVDEVWTITSTLGFEALIRGKPVTTLGAPFYAGWGLTSDLGPIPARRSARPDLETLVHAALIAYPRYRDPLSQLPCPAEIAADRLADPTASPQPSTLRWLAKLQGALIPHSRLWR